MKEHLNRSQAPDIKDFSIMRLSPVEERWFAGGKVKLLLLDDPFAPDVTRVTVLLPGGSAEASEPTLATLAMSQLREGTARHNGEQIADMLDYSGAKLTTAANPHSRSVAVMAINSQLPGLLELMLELILQPTFPEEEFHKAALRIAANIRLGRERNSFLATEASDVETFGPDSPLGRTYNPDNTASLTGEDAAQFHRLWSITEGTTVYAVGHLTPELIAKIELFTQKLATGLSDSEKRPLIVMPRPILQSRHIDLSGEPRNQAAIQITIPLPDASEPGFLQLLFAVKTLGGYFGSRLMANIRENKGYTYGINASVIRYCEGNYMRIATECDRSYVAAVLDEINKEIAGMASRPVEDDEFMRMKRHAFSVKASTLESSFSQMQYRISCDTSGINSDEFIGQQITLESLNAKEIAEISERYLVNAPRLTVIVGA